MLRKKLPKIYLISSVVICAIFVAFMNQSAFVGLALIGGFSPTLLGGTLTLGVAAIQTSTFILISLSSAWAINAVINALMLSVNWVIILVLGLGVISSSIPLFALIPMWQSVAGDGWFAGYTFLTFSIVVFFLMTSAQSVQASANIRNLLILYKPRLWGRLKVVTEFLWWSARGRLTSTLAFALPFSVGGELIAGRGGLGLLATTAYRNGDFSQLSVVAVVYALLSIVFVGPASSIPFEQQVEL